MMTALLLPRIAVASVWIYQGLWCKVLAHAPRHREIAEATAFLTPSQAHKAIVATGILECFIAGWVLSGIGSREAAVVETLLLALMNTAALSRARNLIPDPAGMLIQNSAFLMLAWIGAGQLDCHAAGI